MSEPPRTIVVDVPRVSGPAGLFFIGCLVTVAGVLLRAFARKIAWPEKWSYSGDRVNTDWAYAEALYTDVGLVTMVFGLALVFLSIIRMTAPRPPHRTPDPS